MTIPILSDRDNTIINNFCLEDSRYAGTENERIPYATLYIVNKTSEVMWAHISQNYKIRLTNEKIRKILNSF